MKEETEVRGDEQHFILAGATAAGYERTLVPSMMQAWAPRLLYAAGVGRGDAVLDVACGTGVAARAAAAAAGPAGRVAGLDISEAMLAVARSLPRVAGAPIEWRCAPAETMPYADASFDVVLCQNGLQFMEDRGAALREMRRVLRPGGRLALLVWREIEWSPGFASLATALARHLGDEVAAILRAPFALHDATEIHSLLAEAGFRKIAVEEGYGAGHFRAASFVEDEAAATPLLPHWSTATPRIRAAIAEEVRAATQPFRRGDALVFANSAHVAAARA